MVLLAITAWPVLYFLGRICGSVRCAAKEGECCDWKARGSKLWGSLEKEQAKGEVKRLHPAGAIACSSALETQVIPADSEKERKVSTKMWGRIKQQ